MDWTIEKYLEDVKQSKYNLEKRGLYVGQIKKKTEQLLSVLKGEKVEAEDVWVEEKWGAPGSTNFRPGFGEMGG